eukprot:8336472-Alexandrium_andersonii.AAC.1
MHTSGYTSRAPRAELHSACSAPSRVADVRAADLRVHEPSSRAEPNSRAELQSARASEGATNSQ